MRSSAQAGTIAEIDRQARRITPGSWLAVAAVAIFAISQRQLIAYYWEMWTGNESYCSHGPLVPLLAAVMIWQNKDRLRAAKKMSSWRGIPLMAIAIPLYIVGLTVGWHPVCGIAFFLLAFGIISSLYGPNVLRILFWPVLFLATMVPMPPLIVDKLTGQFQIASTALAVKMLGVLGHAVTQDGNAILSGGLPGPLVVGGACSGLKLLVALVMCGCFLAYMLEGVAWKKIVLITSALPLSLLSNTFRVMLIAYVGFWTGSAKITAAFHDYSGYISLAVCAAIIIGVAWLMGMRAFREFPANSEAHPGRYRADLPRLVAFVLLGVLVASGTAISGMYELPKGHIAREEIPRSFSGWTSEERQLDAYTRAILARADVMDLLYSNSEGRQISVFVESDLDMESFHDPYGCLPGSNIRIEKAEFATLAFKRPRPVSVTATVLWTTDDTARDRLIIYWYMLGDRSYCRTFEDLRGMAFYDRLHDLSRVATHPWHVSDVKDEINQRQVTWYRFAIDLRDKQRDQRDLQQFIGEFISRVPSFGKPLEYQAREGNRG